MKKILITGVAGFLGSNLANFLIEKNYEVIGIDNLIGGDLDNINKKVKFYNFDCQNFEKINKFCKENALLEQAFVKDPNMTINEVITDIIAKLGENISISRFTRFQLGESSQDLNSNSK